MSEQEYDCAECGAKVSLVVFTCGVCRRKLCHPCYVVCHRGQDQRGAGP